MLFVGEIAVLAEDDAVLIELDRGRGEVACLVGCCAIMRKSRIIEQCGAFGTQRKDGFA